MPRRRRRPSRSATAASNRRRSARRRQDVRLVIETNCGSFTIELDQKPAPNDGRVARRARQERLLRRHDLPPDRPRLRHPGRRPDRDGHAAARLHDRRRAAERRRVHAGRRRDGEDRQTEPPGTAGSQFFVVTGPDVGLPPDYAIVGKVTEGIDDVDAIDALGDGRRSRREAGRDRARRRCKSSLIGAVVLAAGAATRFGVAEAAPAPPRRPRARCERGVEEIVVVSGAYELETERACPLPGLGARPRRLAPLRARARSARRSRPRSSCSPTAPSSRPRRSSAWSTRGARRGAPLVAASYGGVRGHPLLRRPRRPGHDIPDEGLALARAAARPVRRPRRTRATSTTLTISRKGSGQNPTNRCRCRCSSSTPHPSSTDVVSDRSPACGRAPAPQADRRGGREARRPDADQVAVARGRPRLSLPFGGQRDRGDAAGRRRARDRPARGAQAGRAFRSAAAARRQPHRTARRAWPRSPRR